MKLELVEDWHKAHKWLSVQIAALIAIVSALYDYVPAIHDYLPEGWSKYAIVLIIAARVIKQREDANAAK